MLLLSITGMVRIEHDRSCEGKGGERMCVRERERRNLRQTIRKVAKEKEGIDAAPPALKSRQSVIVREVFVTWDSVRR